MEVARVGDHFCAHLFVAAINSRRNTPEKRRVVVGGGAKDITGSVEAHSPSVVVELVQKLDVGAVRSEAEYAHAEVLLLAVDRAVESRVADRPVNPVVKTVAQIARASVRVTYTPSGEEHFANIGLVVAIGVLEEIKVRRVRENDAAAGEGHRGGHVEAFGEDGELVGPAVAVGVFANLDAVVAFAAVLEFVRVVHRLDDPQPATLIPRHVDRINNIRLGGEQFHAETDRHLRVFHALRRRERELVFERLGAAFVVRDVAALLIFKRGTTRKEVVVAFTGLVANRPKNATLEQLMKTGVVPHSLVVA